MSTDDKSEAFTLQQRFRGNPQGLAQHLIRICLNQPKVVYEVFLILDDFSILDVGCRFISGNSNLKQLCGKNDGLFLCRKLYKWLTTIRTPILQPTACVGNALCR